MTTTLYYSPGACSISPHIALREAGLPFELDAVDFKTKTTKSGLDFLQINPKGYVPALRLNDGAVLTEGAVIVQ
jgi:glutathione S-transferase